MAGIGVAVEQLDRRVGPLHHRFVDGAAGGDGAHRHGGVGEALGHADHVRPDAEPLGGERRADPAEAGDHLVED